MRYYGNIGKMMKEKNIAIARLVSHEVNLISYSTNFYVFE